MRRVGRVGALLVVAALGLAACGGGGGGSKSASGAATTEGATSGAPTSGASGELIDALTKAGKSDSGTVTISFFGSASDFEKLANATSTSVANAKKARSRALGLKIITGSNFAFSYEKSGKQVKAAVNAKLLGVDHAVELRVVNQVIYLRVAVKDVAKAAGADTSKLDQSASVFSQAGFSVVNDLLAGKWVSLDLTALKGFTKSLSSAVTKVTPSTSAAQRQQLVDAAKNALIGASTVTKVGSDEVGTHYQLNLGVKKLVDAFLPVIAQQASAASGQIAKIQQAASKVPDRTVKVDAWTSGGKVVRIELDLLQFKPAGAPATGRVGVRVDFAALSGSIEAPSGATPVDLSKLGSLLSSFTQKPGASARTPATTG